MQTTSYLTECDHKSCCYKPSYPTVTAVPDGVTEAKHNQVLWTSMQKHCERGNFAIFFPPADKMIISHRCFEFLVWNIVDRTCRKKCYYSNELLFKIIQCFFSLSCSESCVLTDLSCKQYMGTASSTL